MTAELNKHDIPLLKVDRCRQEITRVVDGCVKDLFAVAPLLNQLTFVSAY